MADTTEASGGRGSLIELPQHQIIQVIILGIGLGVGAWLLGLLIDKIIFVPLLCGDPTSAACVTAPMTASNVAGLIIAVVGLMGLVRMSIYRPLLIIIAALISLWGISNWTTHLEWYEAIAWFVLLYALCYIAFAWLVRPRAFVPMIVIVIVAVALIRFLPLL